MARAVDTALSAAEEQLGSGLLPAIRVCTCVSELERLFTFRLSAAGPACF